MTDKPCHHDKRFIDSGDDGTSHCVYCRCLVAEALLADAHVEADNWKSTAQRLASEAGWENSDYLEPDE